MNFFILTLALAIVTGSQAFVLRDAPASPSKTAALFEAVDNIFDKFEKAVEKKWDLIAESKSGKAISEVLDEEDDSGPDVKLPADTQDVIDNMVGLIENVADMAGKFLDFIEEVENVSKPIMKKIDAAAADVLSPLLDPVIEAVEPHLAPVGQNLATKLNELDHKLEEKLKAHLEILDSKVPEQIQKWRESREPQKQARK